MVASSPIMILKDLKDLTPATPMGTLDCLVKCFGIDFKNVHENTLDNNVLLKNIDKENLSDEDYETVSAILTSPQFDDTGMSRMCNESTECDNGTMCNFDGGDFGTCEDCNFFATFQACLVEGFIHKKGNVLCFDKCAGMDVKNYQSSKNWVFKQIMENYYWTSLTRY